MDAGALVECMDEGTAREFVRALGEGALFYRWEGKLYAAVFADPEWWVWEVREGSAAYAVERGDCTCPSRERPCKHVRMVNGEACGGRR